MSATSTSCLAGRHVVLGVTGGIAAYKAAAVARRLVVAGAQVDVLLTQAARRFVGAATFEGLTGRPVRSELWDEIAAGTHVELGRAADAVLVYPATANTIARLAAGLADDLLTNALLVTRAPVLLAPAMHTEMLEHPATTANIATLRERGVAIVGPAVGPLMGGDLGAGRVVEPDEAVAHLAGLLAGGGVGVGAGAGAGVGAGAGALRGRRVLITAGGTREPIDAVRYLGNRSSGRMGFALADVAAARGAHVELVAAPTELATPPGVTRHEVTTALQLHAQVLALLDDEDAPPIDVVIKAAAVADFRPAEVAERKLKKEHGPPQISLVPNPDVLAELGARARTAARFPLLVGFAAETDDIEANGRAKLAAKGADLLVVNDVGAPDAGFEVATNRVAILHRDGGRTEVPLAAKLTVAGRILDVVADALAAREPVARRGVDRPGAH